MVKIIEKNEYFLKILYLILRQKFGEILLFEIIKPFSKMPKGLIIQTVSFIRFPIVWLG